MLLGHAVHGPCQNLKTIFGDVKRSTLIFMETVQLAGKKNITRRQEPNDLKGMRM